MPSEQNAQSARSGGGSSARAEAAQLARDLVRTAWKGTLGTVARAGGHPYGSLVAMATLPDGAPLLLLSGLAEHTKNLLTDQRGSILIDGTVPGRAALTGPRVTLVGRIEVTGSDLARRRYLARHPDAGGFIGFGDFGLYALRIEWAHLVAGFGRIVRLDAADMTVDTSDASAVIDAEPGIIQHMNEDHADAIALMVHQTRTAAARAEEAEAKPVPAIGVWQMIGCDPEGMDFSAGDDALRLHFPQRVTTPDAVRRTLAGMVQVARARVAASVRLGT